MSAWGIFATLFVVVARIVASDSSVCAAGSCDHMSVLQAKVDKHEARDHSQATCQGDRTTWHSGYGSCSTYGSHNSNYCSDDSSGGVLAKDACSECGFCLDPSSGVSSASACQGDRTTWHSGFGFCSTYGSTNSNYCSGDSSGGVLAKDACSECGFCLDTSSGVSQVSSASACKGLGLEDFAGANFTITQTSSLHGGATYTYFIDIGGEIRQQTSDSGSFLIGRHVSYGPGNEQFANGDWCGDTPRSATITFSFGPELKLLTAQEPSMCVYFYEVQLPEKECDDVNAVQTPAPTPPGVPAFPGRFKFTHAGYWNNFGSLIAPFGERGTMTKDECADTCWENQKCAGFNMKPLPEEMFRCYHYDVMEGRKDHEGSWAYIKVFE